MATLKIAITGSTGLVGQVVVKYLKSQGHQVFKLVRPNSKGSENSSDITWDPVAQTIDLAKLEGMDAVIHLAGENLAGKRWSKSFKEKILTSRVQSTTFLCGALHKLKNPPKTLLSASAIGFYGSHHQNEELVETTEPGNDFLAHVCQEWEAATKGAELAGIRVVCLRFGAVLGKKGGALSKMLPVFKLGLGGPIGDGKQIFSWICVDEIPTIMNHLLTQAVYTKGAVNCVSPKPQTNLEYTKILGKVLKRPTIFPLPALMAKLMFGEMADAILLSSANVVPKKLLETGYKFKYESLESAIIKCVF